MDSVDNSKNWYLITAKVRIDSFNQVALKEQLKRAQALGYRQVAIDLRTTRFISFEAIRSMGQFARELQAGGGTFVLVGPTEKAKRHFEIHGALDAVKTVRAPNFLPTEVVDLASDSGPEQGPEL